MRREKGFKGLIVFHRLLLALGKSVLNLVSLNLMIFSFSRPATNPRTAFAEILPPHGRGNVGFQRLALHRPVLSVLAKMLDDLYLVLRPETLPGGCLWLLCLWFSRFCLSWRDFLLGCGCLGGGRFRNGCRLFDRRGFDRGRRYRWRAGRALNRRRLNGTSSRSYWLVQSQRMPNTRSLHCAIATTARGSLMHQSHRLLRSPRIGCCCLQRAHSPQAPEAIDPYKTRCGSRVHSSHACRFVCISLCRREAEAIRQCRSPAYSGVARERF
jgi:hypothetical protein